MLLEDFLKQFEGIDPKSEIGHLDSYGNVSKPGIQIRYVNSKDYSRYNSAWGSPYQYSDRDLKVIVIQEFRIK